MPRISVIIPCYNVEKYLPECLDSVIGQNFSDIEIICVNDGSTDNTLNTLEKYKKQDKSIKIFVWTKFEKRLKFYVNKNQYKLKILGIHSGI